VLMAGPDRKNPVYRELWEREKGELRQEHQRLLYVAMTRACDHLVMIGTLAAARKAGQPPMVSQNTWLQYCIQPSGPGPEDRRHRRTGHLLHLSRLVAPGTAGGPPGNAQAGRGTQEQQPVIDAALIASNISRLPRRKAPLEKGNGLLPPLKEQAGEQDIPGTRRACRL